MSSAHADPMVEFYQAFVRNLPVAMFLYDLDLRLVKADGELSRSADGRPGLLPGERLPDVLLAGLFSLPEKRFRDGLAGIERDVEYRSPVDGRLYETRSRAVRDDDGAVVGAMLLIWDISERSVLQSQIEQARALMSFGSATYRRESGWSIEPSLNELWGNGPDATPEQVLAELIVDEDRERAQRAWTEAILTGRPVSVEYTIWHGRTGDVRHLHGTVRATADRDGVLLRAETTQVDVTDLVRTRQQAKVDREASVAQRDLLLRQVSELLAGSTESDPDTVQAIAELAATAIGDGCVLRTVSPDNTTIAIVAIAHRSAEGRARLQDWTAASPTRLALAGTAVRRTFESGKAHRGVADERDLGHATWATGYRYVIAPAFHRGQLLGSVGLFRADDKPLYDDADLPLVRVLADRFGALLAAERDGVRARELTAELQQINADQRTLVLQLDSTESRERGRLADAVHDDPLQLAVAALLRLDSHLAQLPATDPAAPVISGIAEMLESCIDQLRTLMGTLTPPDLSAGLGPALRRLAEAIFLGTNVSVQVRGPDHFHLDPGTKETIYRIMREGLVNARKHAHATAVSLDLTEDDELVTLRLADNGCGLGPDAARAPAFGHLGMSSMRARAAAANARLMVHNPDTGGTVIELVIPVRYDAPGASEANASSGPGTSGSGALSPLPAG